MVARSASRLVKAVGGRAQNRRVAVSSSTASSGPDVMLEFEVWYVSSDQRLLGHLEDALKDLERAVGV